LNPGYFNADDVFNENASLCLPAHAGEFSMALLFRLAVRFWRKPT
jgi:hypothetical protein